MNILKTTVLNVAGITDGVSTEETARSRDNIFEMTQIAEDAVLRPKDYGIFTHELRAWLAARIAGQAGESELASRYMLSVGITENTNSPNHDTGIDLNSVVNFVDKAANNTSDIEASDISNLQKKGFADNDIVRLCQLLAFVSYQVRITKGLRLMNGGSS